MKLYHTETQAGYDDLMIKLEERGCEWFSGGNPTSKNYWREDKKNSCVKIYGDTIFNGSIEWYKIKHPGVAIIEYKADEQRTLKAQIEHHNSETRKKMLDGSVVTIEQARDYVNDELGLKLGTWHETWTKQANWKN